MMKPYFVKERVFALLGAASIVTLAACEDKRVKQLDTGISRDSAVSVLAKELKPGSGPDSFPNVYMREKFLVGGKQLEVLYFTPNNEKVSKDTIPMKRLTPILFLDNRLLGKGWNTWDSVAAANHIPPKKR